MRNIIFCPKCGHIDIFSSISIDCKYCNYPLIESDCSFEDYVALTKQYKNDVDQVFFDKYIAGRPEFSEEAMENRLREERRKDLYSSPAPSHDRVKCPYCQSEDVKKISVAGRAVSVGLFGLTSQKIGKQWHCNKCKSDF